MATDTTRVSDACMEAGTLTAEHELLKPFAGAWNSQVKMWMSADAAPMVSTGAMTNTLILGGRFLEHDYMDDEGLFQGRGLFGYNTVEKRWEGVWIDTMATFMMIDTGSYDPATKAWTMHGEVRDPNSGHMMRKRSVLSMEDSDHHTMTMYFTPLAGENAGEELKCMEIGYERA